MGDRGGPWEDQRVRRRAAWGSGRGGVNARRGIEGGRTGSAQSELIDLVKRAWRLREGIEYGDGNACAGRGKDVPQNGAKRVAVCGARGRAAAGERGTQNGMARTLVWGERDTVAVTDLVRPSGRAQHNTVQGWF